MGVKKWEPGYQHADLSWEGNQRGRRLEGDSFYQDLCWGLTGFGVRALSKKILDNSDSWVFAKETFYE